MRSTVLLLVLTMVSACASYNPGILRGEIRNMADTLELTIGQHPGIHTVAVTSMKGDDPDLSRWFTRELEAELVTREALAVVDRQNLEQVLEEHQLVLSDVFSEDHHPEIGELLGADGLVITEVQPNDKKSFYSLRSRLVEMETGRILVSDSSTIAARDFEFNDKDASEGGATVWSVTGNIFIFVGKLPLTPLAMFFDIFETVCIDDKGVGSRLTHDYPERVLIGLWDGLPIPTSWIGGIFHNDLYGTRSIWKYWF